MARSSFFSLSFRSTSSLNAWRSANIVNIFFLSSLNRRCFRAALVITFSRSFVVFLGHLRDTKNIKYHGTVLYRTITVDDDDDDHHCEECERFCC